VSVPFVNEQGEAGELAEDDGIRGDTTIEALASLKPVFKEDGIITAGNASAIVDGAAVVLIGSEDAARRLGIRPRARVVSTVSIGSPPRIMLTGPIEASRQALAKAGLTKDQIDLWEINEAFAPVPLVVMNELDIDPVKVNVNGGGISLGHPLGATGSMLLGTALDELERTGSRYALVTMCIGLGMGIATVIERL
jgi:acetyl-CoA acyltransferase